MKYIYTWNEDTKTYNVRVANKEEQDKIKTAINLFERCKSTYNSIIYQADKYYGGNIGRFIDDECWYTAKSLNSNLALVEKMVQGLLVLDTTKYYLLV